MDLRAGLATEFEEILETRPHLSEGSDNLLHIKRSLIQGGLS